MASEWIQSSNGACYDTFVAGYTLSQQDVMTPGQMYFVKITVLNMTQGSITLYGLEDAPVITEDGYYYYFKKATYSDLVIYPGIFGGGVFNGCIDSLEANVVPFYSIKDSDDNTVFEMIENTGVSGVGDYIQYQIDWSEIGEGQYYIEFSDGIFTYKSDCFYVKLTHPCSLQLEWTNEHDSFGFNFSDLSFTPTMRVKGKLWHPSFVIEDQSIYDYSNGSESITNARIKEENYLSIEEMPDYMHRAFAVALKSDSFYIQNVKNSHRDEEISPVWRNSSDLAPVVVKVRQSVQNLLNSNC